MIGDIKTNDFSTEWEQVFPGFILLVISSSMKPIHTICLYIQYCM